MANEIYEMRIQLNTAVSRLIYYGNNPARAFFSYSEVTREFIQRISYSKALSQPRKGLHNFWKERMDDLGLFLFVSSGR